MKGEKKNKSVNYTLIDRKDKKKLDRTQDELKIIDKFKNIYFNLKKNQNKISRIN